MDASRPVSCEVLAGSSFLRDQPRELIESRKEADAMAMTSVADNATQLEG